MTTIPGRPEHAVVAEGAPGFLRDLQRHLDAGGVRAELLAPPAGCGSG